MAPTADSAPESGEQIVPVWGPHVLQVKFKSTEQSKGLQISGKWEYFYLCGCGRTFLVRQEIHSHADILTQRLKQKMETELSQHGNW